METMFQKPQKSAEMRPLAVALLLLAVPVAIFWRPHLPFFYILDDWTALIQMVELPFWQYLTLPDGEQWFPLFHLVFFGLVKMAGERYYLLLMVNCLGTGLNAVLLYLFFRRNLGSALALALSLFYAAAAVHHTIAWHAFYICYILSLGFFLGALLVTDSYLKSPSFGRLLAIGLLSGLSILSHNYTLLGLIALPLYAVLLGGHEARRRSWALALTLGLVYLAFALGYFHYAGVTAASSQNREILSSLPGPTYFLFFLFGAVFYPFSYLMGGGLGFSDPWVGLVISGAVISIILIKGGLKERRLAFWALLVNLLPFVLVGLARSQMGLHYAGSNRYGVFTLVGALLLAGTAWGIFARNWLSHFGTRLLSLALLALMIGGQLQALPRVQVQKPYDRGSKAARLCYQRLNSGGETSCPSGEKPPLFCPEAHPFLTRDQAVAIRRFLEGKTEGP